MKPQISFQIFCILIILFFVIPYILRCVLKFDYITDSHIRMMTTLYHSLILLWASTHIELKPIQLKRL